MNIYCLAGFTLPCSGRYTPTAHVEMQVFVGKGILRRLTGVLLWHCFVSAEVHPVVAADGSAVCWSVLFL